MKMCLRAGLLASFFVVACATTSKPVAQVAPGGREASLQFSRDAKSSMSELPASDALEARAELAKRENLSVELLASIAELGVLGNKLENAAEAARNVLKIDFKNADAMKTLIKVQIFSGRPREAILLSDNALQVQPRDADIFALKGLAFYFLGDAFAARGLWKQALELNPGHIPSHMNLAVLYFQNRNVMRAGAGFERVLALQPSHVDAQIGRALVLDMQGQSALARERLEHVAAENKTAALVFYNLAVLERDRFENYEKALEHMDAYLKISKKDRAGVERAIAMREDLKALVAKKKLGKISDDELRQMAKRSAQARENLQSEDEAKPAPDLKPVPKVEPSKVGDRVRGASQGEDVESLEDALR
jgi:tetratricopeptide (TPR) repeat protein